MCKRRVFDLRLVLVLGLCGFASACAGAPRAASDNSILQNIGGSQPDGRTDTSKRPLLYLTDTNMYTVHIYPASEAHHHPRPLQIISKGDDRPIGMCVDRKGAIYTVNQGFTFERFSFVAVYQAGAGAPSTIIKDGVKFPKACAVDKSGTLFVSNDEVMPNGIPIVVIEEYAHGGVTPTGSLTITDPHPVANARACSGGMTFDQGGNLLVSAEFSTQSSQYRSGYVFKVAPGATKAIDLGLKGIGNTCESGVGIDGSGNLFVGSSSASFSTNIAVFGPGQTTLTRTITKGLTSPRLFSVDSAGRLYVPNDAAPGQPQFANVVEYAPGGDTPVNTITGKDFISPIGTALTPGA
jgi:hypothetical protein